MLEGELSLWTGLLVSSVCAALQAQSMRNHKRQSQLWHDEQIAWYSENERENLARARECERIAEEYRQMAARGETERGGRTWAERAAFNDQQVAYWKAQAAWAADVRRQQETWKKEISSRW